MKNVIIILGPTASGKTALSIALAKELNTQIISADSMQVYKHMDIGTAKPTKEEMDGVEHFLIDEISPDESFSVAQYKQKAVFYIDEIIKRGKIPIVVGGTGLYINSLLYNIEFSESICDWELREKLNQDAQKYGNEYLHDLLAKKDQKVAEKLHVNDTKRIIRAIEVLETTGKSISHFQELSRKTPTDYTFTVFGLLLDRKILYERINTRVDRMIDEGLIFEVQKLIENGFDKSKISMQAIGYKEILCHLNGEISLDEAIELIKRESRRYAKRQMTWFRRLENVTWLDVETNNNWEILKKIKDILATINNI